MPSFFSYLKLLYRSCFGQILLLCVCEVVSAASPVSDQKSLSLNGINLSARALLQGPYDVDTGLMANDLQVKGFLPTVQPFSVPPFEYSGSEKMRVVVSLATGQDAPVDWLLLEVREDSNPYALVERKAVILQRDGDIVDPKDGAVVLSFLTVTAANYRVSVRHRNHIGVMTAASQSLSTAVTLVDFSQPETEVFGTHSRVIEGQYALLWGGDSTQDNRLINAGVGNDNSPVLSSILVASDNTGFNSSYIIDGYEVTDFNMDGKTIYSGPGNDVNLLVSNILIHPKNSAFANNFIVSTGLDF